MNTTTVRSPRTPLTRGRGVTAGFIASAMMAVGLVGVAAPAQADEPAAPALKWRVSQAMAEHLSVHTPGGGATEDANKVVTFPNGTGYTDPVSGKTSVSYEGSVEMAFTNAGSKFYYVSVANPQITVDAAGNGVLTAEVGSALVQAFGGQQPQTIAPARVKVTTFDADASDWTRTDGAASLTTVPDWAGVIAPNSAEATAAGIPAGFPLSGKAFAPEFFAQIVQSAKSWFYVNGTDENSTTNLKKSPAEFTATVKAPVVTAEVSKATPKTGLDIAVTGTGFSPAFPGVYVSLGEKGNFADADASVYLATAFVPNSTYAAGGAFSTTVSLTGEQARALSADKDYVITTQKAHGQSAGDPSQNTQTPVEIDVDAFVAKESSTTLSGLPATSDAGDELTADIAVTSEDGTPTGSVALLDGETTIAEGDLEGGETTVVLPTTLTAGEHVLTAKYSGDDEFAESQSTTHTLTINAPEEEPEPEAAPSTTTLTAPAGKHGVTGKATVTVKAEGKTVGGTVTLTGDGSSRTATVRNGVASFNLSKKLTAKKYTLKATYEGDDEIADSTATLAYTVTKGSATAKISSTTKPTTSAKGSIRVTVTSPGVTPGGKVRVLLTKSGKTYQSTTGTVNSSGRVRVTLPKLNKRGTWNVVVRYYGDSNHLRSDSKKTTIKVAK